MDIKRTNVTKKKSIILIATATAVIIVGLFYISTMDFHTRRVNRSTLLVGTVQHGDLVIKIGANGVLLARHEGLITSQVEGRVITVNVKPGHVVERGQVLVELANSSLLAAVEQAASVLDAAIAERASYGSELENSLLNQKTSMLQAEFALEKSKLDLDANRELFAKNIISRVSYQKAELDAQQLSEIHRIEKERYERVQANMKSLLLVQESRVIQARQGLQKANEQVESLKIMSQMNGVVQEINVVAGQQLQPGHNVGRIADQTILYAELKVPERQASDLVLGQRVEIDTRSGKIEGRISRIDPAVIDGSVLVDVDLVSELPRSARPELAVEGIIYIKEIKDTLYVGKPAMSQANSEIGVYKLDAAERYADRVTINVGSASVNDIEVVEGLEAGDKIILSQSNDWKDYSRILLN